MCMSAKRPPKSIATKAVISAIVKRPLAAPRHIPETALYAFERSGSYFETCVRSEQTIQVPSGDSTSRSPLARVGRALRGWVQGEAPPDTGRLQPIRRGANRHQVRAPAPHLTSSSRGIQRCGFAQPGYQLLPAEVQSLFLRQIFGPDAGSAQAHDCRVSYDEPPRCDRRFPTLPTPPAAPSRPSDHA